MNYQGINLEEKITKERDAIVKFLDTYWDVKVKEGENLEDIIYTILEKGAKSGLVTGEKDTKKAVEAYNWYVNAANNYRKDAAQTKKFEKTSDEADYIDNFQRYLDTLVANLKKDNQLKAEPKKYREFVKEHEDEEFVDTEENLEFEGTKLHYKIGACCPDLNAILNKPNIKYSEFEQGRDPITELASAVIRQGMNIGILAVEEKYGKTIEMYDEGKKLYEEAAQTKTF